MNIDTYPQITIDTSRTTETQSFREITKKLVTHNNYKVTLKDEHDFIGGMENIQYVVISLYNNKQIVGCYIPQTGLFFNKPNEVSIRPVPRVLTNDEKNSLINIVNEYKKEKWSEKTKRFNLRNGTNFDIPYLRSVIQNIKKQSERKRGSAVQLESISDSKQKRSNYFETSNQSFTVKFRIVDNTARKISQNNQFHLRISIVKNDGIEFVYDSNCFCIISKVPKDSSQSKDSKRTRNNSCHKNDNVDDADLKENEDNEGDTSSSTTTTKKKKVTSSITTDNNVDNNSNYYVSTVSSDNGSNITTNSSPMTKPSYNLFPSSKVFNPYLVNTELIVDEIREECYLFNTDSTVSVSYQPVTTSEEFNNFETDSTNNCCILSNDKFSLDDDIAQYFC
ncbi:hypothetical protein ABK040_012788 [Willaertia magna]